MTVVDQQQQEARVHAGAGQPQPVELWGEWLASRRAGQLVFRGVDSVLRLVEKTLMWSAQSSSSRAPCSDDAPECGGPKVNGKTASLVVVSRPLAWPLFLPLLGALGVVRVTVYCVSRIIRKPCDTTDMIHWLQSKRRRLRAIKYAGIKNMRAQAEIKPGRTPNGTPCRKPLQTSTTPDQERKRKYDDVEQSDWTDGSDDESVAVKLEKYGEDYDSESDPDFVPSSEEGSSEDEGSAASGDDDVEDEEGAVLVNGADAAIPTSPPKAPLSPSIVTVESPESARLLQSHQPVLEVV